MEEKVYSLEEARQLVPWLMEISREAERRLRALQQGPLPVAREEVGAIIQDWAETVWKLGGLPKQPFTVDFNSGTDYFCWEYPETTICFRHDYERGYAGRHRIEEA